MVEVLRLMVHNLQQFIRILEDVDPSSVDFIDQFGQKGDIDFSISDRSPSGNVPFLILHHVHLLVGIDSVDSELQNGPDSEGEFAGEPFEIGVGVDLFI